ncbi:phosphatase PAP2 family protein [Lacticaseibacillus camelliae]|uniref:phosphatase PAP2 family protein n=1 Tax=Lacticaseibacillus camelliae TaxID=381742 RepID=UPI0006D052B5|nr:phosphatase PAP2 family protein [Lacticaseibacillus camelliae]
MNSKVKTFVASGLFLLLLFAGLAWGVADHAPWVRGFDRAVSGFFASAESPLNTGIFKLVGTLGSPATVIGLTAVLCLFLWIKRDLITALWAFGIQLFGSAIAEIIKQLVARARPLHQLVPDTGYSFPSGHTFCTVLFVFTLLMLGLPLLHDQETKLVAVLAGMIWIGLVAASRVYLRDHFATDVVASVLLATGYWLIITPFAAAVQDALRRWIPERIQTLWTHKN